MIQVDVSDIVNAYSKINPYIRNTPLFRSKEMSEEAGCDAWFKMDSLQVIGAYKLRGALNNILSMSDEELRNGVVAASAGNHSQAVAHAAQLKNVSAVVCVPESTPMNKRAGAVKYGAELIVYGKNYDLAEKYAHEIEKNEGRRFIHAYESKETIAGAGTVALESFLQEGEFDSILVPTGGGGLLCGVAIIAKAMFPNIKVYGLQTNTSPPWLSSFKNKKLDNSCEFLPTCADGLEGEITWPNVELALKYVDDIIIVDEQSTRKGVKWMADKHHYMIEGASATCLAALFEQKSKFKNQKVLSIITGSNIDLDMFIEICSQNY